MSLHEVPNAGALSEFVSGYNGDCGETAEICLLHTLDPQKYPLDAAALAPMVRRDIAHGWASANGAEPLSSIAHDLDALGDGRWFATLTDMAIWYQNLAVEGTPDPNWKHGGA